MLRLFLRFSDMSNFIFLLFLCFQRNIAKDEFDDFHFHDNIINVYLRYRQELGCHAPLCKKLQKQNVTKYTNKGEEATGTFNADGNTSLNDSTYLHEILSLNDSVGCCSDCSCSDDCQRYGNCCPDKLTRDFINSSEFPLGGIFECGHNSVKEEPDKSKRSVKMISKCKRQYKELEIIKRCTAPRSDKLKDYRIVSHLTTYEAYKNIYCARCNYINDDDVIPWQIKIRCRQGVFWPQNMSEIVTEIRNYDQCNVIFEPPADFNATACQTAISKCNVTGQWLTNHSRVLEKACDAFVSEFRSGNQTYKNSFCYICNSDDKRKHTCENIKRDDQLYIGLPDIFVSFSALLDFTEPVPSFVKPTNCGINSIYDLYKGICRDIICPPLTVLNYGFCKRAVLSTRGLKFEVTIKMFTMKSAAGNDMKRSIETYFETVAENCTGNISFAIDIANSSDNELNTKERSGHTFFVFIQFRDDLDFAERMIDYDHSSISIDDSFVKDGNGPRAILSAMSDLKYSLHSRDYIPFSTELVLPSQFQLSHSLNETIVISKFLKCQMIELNLSNFKVKEKEDGLLFVEFNLFLMKHDFIESKEDIIRVCAEDYIPSAQQYLVHQGASLINIMSIVCLCMSVVCLIITIIIYSLFSELRTQPGLNNMFLSGSLLLAFTGLFVGGIRAIEGLWCSIVGLLVHFLWINSIFWLNVCCFHMYRTFGSLRILIRKNTSWVYHVYCLTGSTVFINVNIIWSLNTSGGRNIGYGKHTSICYIFYPQMVAYTMALPVGLIVIANFIMYTVVICRIRKDSLTTSNRSPKHFSVYMKLSTITGVLWLSYIPAHLSEVYVFTIVFSVLVACQGLFIMIAFICNRRVIFLCKSLLKERQTLFNPFNTSNEAPSKELCKKAIDCGEKETTNTLM